MPSDSVKLGQFISETRKARIEAVLRGRTRDVAVVLDGTHDLGNVHAVVRTAEGLGFDQLHVVESQEKFRKANRTAQGADTWVDFHRYASADECVKCLRARGYSLLVTTLEGDRTLEEVDFTNPVAVVLGNEKAGVSAPFLSAADYRVKMPMSGFAQSFNVSVAAAIVLWTAFRDRVAKLGSSGNLSETEIAALRERFYKQSVREAETVLRELGGRGRSLRL